MFTKKTISRLVSALFVVVFMLAALPVQSVQIVPTGNPASAAPADLLQFTAGGHALGFSAANLVTCSSRKTTVPAGFTTATLFQRSLCAELSPRPSAVLNAGIGAISPAVINYSPPSTL